MKTKRILSIEFKRTADTNPDTSYLGKYSHDPDVALPEFSIDRTHELNCDLNNGGQQCTCAGGNIRKGTYRYFNPASVEPFNPAASWFPPHSPTCNVVTGCRNGEICCCHGMTDAEKRTYWLKTMRENARKDYERMEAYNRGDWEYIGVRAYANVVVDGVNQSIASGGLWGIESDSEESYLRSVEQEQLRELRGILHELGFSTRAIAAAVKAICAGPSADFLCSHTPDCAQRIGGACTCGVFQHNQTIYESED